MKNLLRILTDKIVVVGLVMLVQVSLILYFAMDFIFSYNLVYMFMILLSILLLIVVINRNDNPSYALAWAIVILAAPPFGAVIYLLFGGRQTPKKLRERITESFNDDDLVQDETIMTVLKTWNPNVSKQVQYIYNNAHFPIFKNRHAEYLKSGELKFKRMLEEIEKAKNYIFLEYFIIRDGYMWQTLLALLEKKIVEGVDVRLIYDDWGCAPFRELNEQCVRAGIKTVVFNPLVPRLAIQMNNRSHRKACIVDGRVGIVGGINLADEYINKIERFGHWKDTAVLFEGEAVHSLTLMFLQFYQYYTGIQENPDDFRYVFDDKALFDGYIQPFADAPTDDVDVGIESHLNIISNAKRYVYIQTPYLIIGYELLQALRIAALSGVDVRLILPHIPDKKVVNQVTKSNYESLLESGVRIYEYEPGFVHSKTIVADDEVCMVGTTNMDFRSYYMHFESTVLFVDNDVVMDCYQDVMETFECSIEITYHDVLQIPSALRLFRGFVRIFSGLL